MLEACLDDTSVGLELERGSETSVASGAARLLVGLAEELRASPGVGREFFSIGAASKCALPIEPKAKPCPPSSEPFKGEPATIGFEFDLDYSASTMATPTGEPDSLPDFVGVTCHESDPKKDGFKVTMDGPRLEIATQPFELTDAGRKRMETVLDAVVAFADELKSACEATTVSLPKSIPAQGVPRAFTLASQGSGVHYFPLSHKAKPFFRWSSCDVSCAPQATIVVPLESVSELVCRIERSMREEAKRRLTGTSAYRQGLRSTVLYDARDAVNKSFIAHATKGTKLGDGTKVGNKSFTRALQGFMILMVSYLRTSEIDYDLKKDGKLIGVGDYESFAKSYLPLNVKNHFYLLLRDLTKEEQRVFLDIYADSSKGVPELFKLAARDPKRVDPKKLLFPAPNPAGTRRLVHVHQEGYFTTPLTWEEFLRRTVRAIPIKRTSAFESYSLTRKKCHKVGDEMLPAALSSPITHKAGSRRVALEMRRLGFRWYPVEEWKALATRLFDLALSLNEKDFRCTKAA